MTFPQTDVQGAGDATRPRLERQQLRRPAPANRISGTHRYLLDDYGLHRHDLENAIWRQAEQEAQTNPALREKVTRGQGCREQWEWNAIDRIEALRERQAREQWQRVVDQYRTPGWRVPEGQRSTWPIYPREAITVDTPWGPVTVGRHLARIYDLDGWPDAGTLEAMAREQADRNGAPK
jgi:hypothetical protein